MSRITSSLHIRLFWEGNYLLDYVKEATYNKEEDTNDMIQAYIKYLKDNPQGYWFKARLYGWGWTPARWQGWLVIAIGLAFIALGIYIGDTDDAPGAALLGILLMIVFICTFGYWKGEKPRWQWGPPKDTE